MSTAIGLGAGLAGMVTLGVLAFVIHLKLISRSNSDSNERRAAVEALSTAYEKIASYKDAIAVHERNVDAMKLEIEDLRTESQQQAARLAASERTSHDLLAALESSNNAGALPLALRSELDRLRSHLPGSTATTSGTATGDSSSGETGVVHGEIDVHSPR